MKISRKTLVYAGIGAYIIIVASLCYVLSSQYSEKTEIEEELDMTKANLERVNPEKLRQQKGELEEQVTQVQSQYDTLKDMLSHQIANVEATSIVFDTAESTGVEVTELTSPSATNDVLENVPFTVVSLEATVVGDVPDIVEFVTSLNTALTTGVIKSVNLNIPDVSSNMTPSAGILLVIYNYQGS